MKNTNISLLDVAQIQVQTFDSVHDAQRVILVGSDGQQIANAVKDALMNLKVEVNALTPAPLSSPIPQIDPLVIKIPYQTVVKETEFVTIEKPIIVYEYKTIEIEKPIIIREIEIREIEKQVIVKEYEHKPTLLTGLLMIQTLATIILSIMHFLSTHRP